MSASGCGAPARAGAETCRCGAECAGCAGRAAAMAQLEAERDAAVRRAAETSCALVFEREERENAEASLLTATDRLEFVGPMYAVVRARYEELYGMYGDLSRRHGELGAEKAALEELFGLVKRQAARTVALEARNAELEEYIARTDCDMRRLLAELQRHVKGKVVYPTGPNTPPSEARRMSQGGDASQDGGGGSESSSSSSSSLPSPRPRGRRKPRRTIPGKPGGRKGHKGHGVSFDSNAETVIHKFRRRADGGLILPKCPCGKGCWDLGDWITRIIRDIKFVLEDTRHVSERASCTGCGAEAWASDGIVPRKGAYGANMVAFVVLLRDNNVKYHVIASTLADMAGRPVMSKAAAIAIYARTADANKEESVEILREIEESGTAGGDETLGLVTYIRLTARVAELIWMSEYIRGALPAIAGGCACAVLSEVLPEEPALPAPDGVGGGGGASPALPAPDGVGGGGGASPALPAPDGVGGGGEDAQEDEAEEAPACRPGGDAAPRHGAMDLILSTVVESASALRASGGADAEDAADAAVGLSLDSIGAAFLNATVGTEVGAQAEAARQDGTPNGITWVWIVHNDEKTAFRSATTRAGMVMERYMGRFVGAFVADRYVVYTMVFNGSEIQWCWAHELRHHREDALRPDATDEAADLAAEIGRVFSMSKRMLKAVDDQRSHGLRIAMESELGDVLDRHAGSDDPVVLGMVKRARRGIPHLFVFLEYDVDPTNNRSEDPLRRPVTFRKSSQQCKGGRKSMERSDHMSTCTRSWRDKGKSVFGEIRRSVLEHGTPWKRRPGRRGWPPPPPPPATSGPGPPAAHAVGGADANPAQRRRRAGPASRAPT